MTCWESNTAFSSLQTKLRMMALRGCGVRAGALPRFSMEGFSAAMKKGLEEQKHVEQEKKVEKERWAAMWTTPGLRPLAEPPALDWDGILDREFSEHKLNALFAGKPEKQCMAKDLKGEMIALAEYHQWCNNMCTPDLSGISKDDPRGIFYQQLLHDIAEEWAVVGKEWDDLYSTATNLGAWEYMWLDKDGKTTWIEHQLRMGKNIFRLCGDAEVKYGFLRPTGYEATPLGVFEYEWLDEQGGTGKMEEELRRGRYILTDRAEEVKRKYGALQARYLGPESDDESENFSSDG